MTMPSSIGGSGNPSTPSMPRPSDTTPPRSNASSVRSVIDSSFSVLPPLFLDGGANAGRTPHAPPPSINLHSPSIHIFILLIILLYHALYIPEPKIPIVHLLYLLLLFPYYLVVRSGLHLMIILFHFDESYSLTGSFVMGFS